MPASNLIIKQRPQTCIVGACNSKFPLRNDVHWRPPKRPLGC